MRRLVSFLLALGIGLSLSGCVVYRDDPWCARHPQKCGR